MKRSISVMVGKGSVSHNSRMFIAENVDKARTENNIVYCNKSIKNTYKELFGEAVKRYNAKQTRNDRKIENYYEKIRTGKQEKLFHEIILQIGNCDDMNAKDKEGQLAKKVLEQYMQGFEKRNSNLKVFSAHLHMDEATPHLHIDFVPFTTGSKRGLDTRVSLKQALATQGFKGGSRSDTEWTQWVNSEKEKLSEIMLEHGIEWDKKGTHEKHKTVSEFKRDMLAKEVTGLMEQKDDLKHEISVYKNEEQYALVTAQKYEAEEWRLPEPSPIMSAKTYKNKFADPLVKKLVGAIKTLARKYYEFSKTIERLQEKISILTADNEKLKNKLWYNKLENSKLSVKARAFEKVKSVIGVEKISEIIKSVNRSNKKQKFNNHER